MRRAVPSSSASNHSPWQPATPGAVASSSEAGTSLDDFFDREEKETYYRSKRDLLWTHVSEVCGKTQVK